MSAEAREPLSVHAHPVLFLLELADAFERIGREGTAAGLRVVARMIAECRCGEATDAEKPRPRTRKEAPTCPVCGGQLPPPKPGQPREFCSAKCRKAAWRARRGTHGNAF